MDHFPRLRRWPMSTVLPILDYGPLPEPAAPAAEAVPASLEERRGAVPTPSPSVAPVGQPPRDAAAPPPERHVRFGPPQAVSSDVRRELTVGGGGRRPAVPSSPRAESCGAEPSGPPQRESSPPSAASPPLQTAAPPADNARPLGRGASRPAAKGGAASLGKKGGKEDQEGEGGADGDEDGSVRARRVKWGEDATAAGRARAQAVYSLMLRCAPALPLSSDAAPLPLCFPRRLSAPSPPPPLHF